MNVTIALENLVNAAKRESRTVVAASRAEAEDWIARRAGQTANRATELGDQLATLTAATGERLAELTDRWGITATRTARETFTRAGTTLARWSEDLGDNAVRLGERLTERAER